MRLICGNCDADLGDVDLPLDYDWLDSEDLLDMAMQQVGVTACPCCLSVMLVVLE